MQLEEIIREKHLGDQQQLEFIFSNEKKIIVTAPAGCGKTTAMVSKIARELRCENIQANKKVLAMTFSVNAAMKIKDSLKKMLPDIVENEEYYLKKVDIANYHNFAMRILAKYGYVINSQLINVLEFQIVDDSSKLLSDFIIQSEINKLKDFSLAVQQSNAVKLKNNIKEYWNILNQKLIPNNIITYNGLLVSAIKLISNKEISSFFKKYYQMIIIDEFQDTNLLGYYLLKKLIDDNIVIFLGDDIQKIYGFLGAVDGIFDMFSGTFTATEMKFYNNYRFRTNDRMKKLDAFVRSYAENYCYSGLDASLLLKILNSDDEEDEFISEGIEKIITKSDNKVAVLVRAGWQGNSIAQKLDSKGIRYFNALFKDTDIELQKFYSVAIEEFINATHGTGKAIQRDLKKCLVAVQNRQCEIYDAEDRKFIFDSMFQLLEVLFEQSKMWEGTSKERYDSINFTLGNCGLKHMMEFISEDIVLTTIHAAKGLEWDYVIVPRLNSYSFPSSFVCRECKRNYSNERGQKYCKFTFNSCMQKKFKEEISVLYVAITRAKKDVYMTTNTGLNSFDFNKQVCCYASLEGMRIEDYNWDKWERDIE